MTLELAPTEPAATAGAGIRWMSPESGLWVATRDGEFLGMIERTDGRYHASDAHGRPRGSFEGLGDAQFAVDRQRDIPVGGWREIIMLRATIILSGLATIGLAYGIFQLAS